MAHEDKKTPPQGEEGEARQEPHFDVDPEIARAMKEAEDAEARRERAALAEEGLEPDAIPTAGAGEGLIRALAEIKEARVAQAEAEARAKDAEDRLLRTAADLENYKKRMVREREEEKKYAVEGLLKELLPVLDNLERAIEAADAGGDSGVVDGIRMVARQFLDVLGRFGVEQHSAVGQPFDPNFHEAMQQMETDAHPPGHVAQEYAKGYSLQGRLVRPAMVVVAAAPSDAAGDED